MSAAVTPLGCASFLALAPGRHTHEFYKLFGNYEVIESGAWFHLPLESRPYFLRQGKPPALAWLLAALAQPMLFRTRRLCSAAPDPRPGLVVRTSPLPDGFSNRPYIGEELAVVNDAEWYRWRMQPVVDFKDQDQFIQAVEGDVCVGFAICGHVQRFVRPDTASSCVGIIKECRTRPGHEGVTLPLLRACVHWLRSRPRLEGIRMFAATEMGPALTALGFSQRESHRALIGGPLLTSASSVRPKFFSHNDAEVRTG